MEMQTAPRPLDYGHAPRLDPRRVLRIVVVSLLVIAAAGAAGWYITASLKPTIGVNVSRGAANIANIPADADNVSYYRGGWFDPIALAYECDASELEFHQWVERQGWTLQQGAFTIRRFDGSAILLTNALYCSWQQGSRGNDAAYDRDSGRVYHLSYSR